MRFFIIIQVLFLAVATAAALKLGAPNVPAAAPKSARIVGGAPTTIDRYPDMVQVLKLHSFSFGFHCGGVILHSRAFLSAAHCTYKASPIDHAVRVGTSFRNGTGSLGTFRTRRVINHPNYTPRKFDHDICIILLRQAIPVTPLNTPKIAKIADPNYHLPDNEPVWTAGWGLIDHGDHYVPPEQLHHVQVYTINHADCVKKWINRTPPIHVTDNELCAGVWNVGGRDTCTGDSGGPVYHNGVVVGIVAWGDNECRSEYPGVYASVSYFRHWIDWNSR